MVNLTAEISNLEPALTKEVKDMPFRNVHSAFPDNDRGNSEPSQQGDEGQLLNLLA